jgi:LCP family protein required for cell wall assembly
MRTTLKRGIGRSGVSGDGNGNGTPSLPPAVITPVSRYRQPDEPGRTKLAWTGRILLWVLVVLLVLGAGLAGGAYLYFNHEVAAVSAHTADVKIAQKRLSIPLPGQPAIALIAGYDHRANESAGTPSRSDTVMLLRADPQEKAISMLSFPRDLIVNVTCPGKPTFRGRINAAYTECGARGTLETVKDLTGLPINYLITVNFHGFKQIVDKLGGVWMDIDRRYYNRNTGSAATNYADIDLHAGYQRLNGSDALSFVRYRHTDSDFYRVIRQQMFVKALKQQIQHSFSPFKLPGIVGAITKNVEVGVGGGDGLTGKTVLSYALFAYGLPAGHFFQAKIQGLSGYADVTTSDQNLQDAIRQFTTPDVAAPTKATDVTLGRRIRSAAPSPQHTTLLVLNGNGITGSAATAGYAFARRGYQIVVPPAGQPANAPRFDYFHSTVYYDPARAGAKAAATAVANLFGDADVAALPATIHSYGSMLVAVVGQTFHGSIAPAPVDETPRAVKANVDFDPAMSNNLVRDAQRKLPFKAMVPSVMERSSVPDSEEPNRVYWFDKKHRALRLVYRTGATEYWGIEETDWTDAPILAGRNSTHVLRGRPYDLYYSGPHLHMVVLRWNNASYWVVNTLQDTLSNETMLAIAKGLRTYGK